MRATRGRDGNSAALRAARVVKRHRLDKIAAAAPVSDGKREAYRIRGRLLAAAAALLAACGVLSGAPSPPARAAAYPIAVPAGLPVASYDYRIGITPAAHRLSGEGAIDLPAMAAPRRLVELELREEFTLLRVTVGNGPGASPAQLSRTRRGDQFIWTVRPTRPIPSGSRVRLNVAWEGGRAESSRFLHIGPEISFANGSRESWLPRPVGIATSGTLRFSVPAGLTVVAMGARTSTPGEERAGRFRFVASVPGEPWFAAGRYTVLRRGGPVPTAVYLLTPRDGVAAYADGCTRIIEVLGRHFGGYPFGAFALVELPLEITTVAGGFNALGAPGAIMTQGGAFDAPFNLAYFGHEIGHQWWGNVVTRDSADGRGDYMMDEAMADLASLLAVEAIEGPAAGERYRRTGYPGFTPDTYSGLGYLKLAAAGLDAPFGALPDSAVSMRLARSRGGRIWYALREAIGAPRFAQVAAAVVRRHAFRPVTWTAFLRSISQAAGRDLSEFYAEHFDRVGVPAWSVRWRSLGQGRVEVTVEQPEPAFRGRVPIEIVGQDDRRRGWTMTLTGARNTHVFVAPGPIRSVAIDPHFTQVSWTPDYRSEATALIGFTRGRLAEGSAAKLAILRAALADVAVPDRYAVRYQLHALMGSILAADENWRDARVELEAAIASPVTLPDRLPLTWLRLATVARGLNDRALLRRAVDGAVTADAAVGNSTGAAVQARRLLQGVD